MMSDNSLLRFPSVIRIGDGVIKQHLVNEVKVLGGKNVLLVTDAGIVKAGLAKQVESILKDKSIPYHVFTDVEPEPSIETVNKCIAFAKAKKADLFIGLGGGSPMDVCKAAALCMVDDTDIRDLFGAETVKRPGLNKILIPTTSGSGSECSPSIVLSDHSNDTKKAVWSRYALAEAVLIDPAMTVGMPRRITGESGADALSHSIEAYLAKNHNSITDALALEALTLIGRYLKAAYDDGANVEARMGMMKASFLAGMAFGGSGLGCVHAVAYPFTTLFGHSHGRAQGMSMPNVLRFNSVGNEERYARITRALGVETAAMDDTEAAALGIDFIEKLINEIGISTNLKDYPGITPDRFEEMADIAITSNSRLVATNPRAMTVEDAKNIYYKSYK